MKKTGPDRDIFDIGSRGLSHYGLRRANEKAVLTIIGFNGGVSNAEISRLSGLAPQTVSAILNTLEAEGLIKRGEVLRGRRGQPATPIWLNETGGYGFGVEIGWRHLEIVLINMHAQVLAQRRISLPFPDVATIFDTIAALAEELSAVLPADHRPRLLDLGIAMPTRIDDSLGQLGASDEQVEAWRRVDVVAELTERTGIKTTLLNDGNAACWAELIALERPRPPNILYFLVSEFVATGVVANGVLWEGRGGSSANLGSMLVQGDEDGPTEAHQVASLWALRKRLGIPDIEIDINIADGVVPPEIDAWLADSTTALAWTAYNAMTMIESPILIIDTVFHRSLTERLASDLAAELDALPKRGVIMPKIKIGNYGRLAPSMGAAELPMFRRYF